MNNFKRVFLDIETSPNIVYSWRVGSNLFISYDSIIQERRIICACWKYQGDDRVYDLSWDKKQDDKKMLIELLEVLNEADEIVAHFGDSFDLPWIRTRMLYHGLIFPEYKTVDTLQWARKKFYFNSTKLDYLAKFLGIGEKIKTEFKLWVKIMEGDQEALDYMIKYNKMDVVLLEKVWKRLSEVVKPKSHIGVMNGDPRWTCPRDGSDNVHINKKKITASGTKTYQMQCNKCGGYYSINEPSFKAYEERLV